MLVRNHEASAPKYSRASFSFGRTCNVFCATACEDAEKRQRREESEGKEIFQKSAAQSSRDCVLHHALPAAICAFLAVLVRSHHFTHSPASGGFQKIGAAKSQVCFISNTIRRVSPVPASVAYVNVFSLLPPDSASRVQEVSCSAYRL
jgi:hypothetical protein